MIRCSVGDCIYNDGYGSCEKDEIYISDEQNGEPICLDYEEEY